MAETDNNRFQFLARKMRERAKEAQALGETFRDAEARRAMFEIAERYEGLARRLEMES